MSEPKYIAAGFKADAAEIIEAFIQENSPEFPDFAKKWKERNFVCVYMGKEKHELNQFTGEIFHITLKYLDHASFLYQVGGIYLLYCLFRSQLLEPKLRIRVTLPQMKILNNILTTVSKDRKYITLHYVIDYLMKHALDFVANGKMMGPRTPKEKEECAEIKTDFAINESKTETTVLTEMLENLTNDFCEYEGIIKGLSDSNIFPSQRGSVMPSSSDFQNLLDDLKIISCDKKKVMNQNREGEVLDPSYISQDIGSRRVELKATQFGRAAMFRQLNPESTDEDKRPEPKKRLPRKRLKKEDRRVGRPRKIKELEKLLMEKLDDQMTRNKDDEVRKTPKKRGPIEKFSYLDNYDQFPSTSSTLKNLAVYTGHLSDESSD